MFTVTQSTGLRVVPISTPALHRAFCDFPYRLYRSDPYWVPPLRSMEHQRWSPRHNASLRCRWYRRFVAYRNGQIVGRIAAIIDPGFCRRWVPGGGFFGFFECPDEQEAASALLREAETALRGEGVRHMLGPVNLTTHDEVGLLVGDPGARPMLLSPYNPPYYERLLRQFGFAPRCDYHAYEWAADREHSPVIDRLLRRYKQPATHSDFVIRSSQPGRWREDVRLLFELYNACFDQTWGFVPMSWEEFQERADRFRSFYLPPSVLFAEVRGKPVGFALVLPDINEALAKVHSRSWPFGWLRLALAVRRIRTGRFILLGVLPGFTGAGIAALLAHEAMVSVRRLGICRGELSLVHQDNHKVAHVIEAFGGERRKTYRLFEKVIVA